MISSLISLIISTSFIPTINKNTNTKPAFTQEVILASTEDFKNPLQTGSFPIKNPYHIAPIIDAKAVISMDLNSGMILFDKNSHQRLPIASITKLMTILIILQENSLTEIVTISKNSATTEGSSMHLKPGEKIAIQNLLYGALIHSANDATIALAEHNAGNVQNFVEKMNKKSKELGLLNTRFSNPTGLDNGQNAYSSAYDVAKLAHELYDYEFIRHASSIKELEVASENNNQKHQLKSTNKLLDSYLNIRGLKTGSTLAAGECLVSIAENDQGKPILSVVLNSPDRFRESKIILDWSFRAFNW